MKTWKEAISETEQKLLHEALTKTGGDIKAAADLLDVVRTQLHRKVQYYRVDMPRYRKIGERMRAKAKAEAAKAAARKKKKRKKRKAIKTPLMVKRR